MRHMLCICSAAPYNRPKTPHHVCVHYPILRGCDQHQRVLFWLFLGHSYARRDLCEPVLGVSQACSTRLHICLPALLSAEDFIAAITQHIPEKGFQMVRYYGWYSNRARGGACQAAGRKL
ncbi:transposase [Verrucomicrobiota bacterium]